MDSSMLVQLIGDLGSLGFILWLVHRTTTHTIPRLAKEFAEATEKLRQDFKEILQAQREDFRRELEREREINGKQTERIIEAIRETRA
jgi:glutathionylspermidine synthase